MLIYFKFNFCQIIIIGFNNFLDGRLHKSINPYGIAVMCPDATSEFRERKFEQSSLITPDSVGKI